MYSPSGRNQSFNCKQIQPLITTQFDFLQDKIVENFIIKKISEPLKELKEMTLFSNINQLNIILTHTKLSQPDKKCLKREDYKAFIIQNIIFLQKEDNTQENDFLTLDITLSYLVIKKGYGLLKKELVFQRQDSLYNIEILEYKDNQQTIKKWIREMNPFVLRVEQLQSYSLLEKLGEGGQGKVFKVTKNKYLPHLGSDSRLEDGKYYAVKTIKVQSVHNEFLRSQLVQEVQTMILLRGCENILSIRKMFINDSFFNLFLEYQSGGTLNHLILQNKYNKKEFTEQQSKLIAAQLLLAIDYMQIRGIIHRDIKTANILLSQNKENNFEIRLADLGYAIQIQDLMMHKNTHVCGTPGYMAPECLKKQGYSINSDIFSAACIIYSVITGSSLFYSENVKQLIQLNRECNKQYIQSKLSSIQWPIAQDLLIQMLNDNGKSRISAQKALDHEWFDCIREPLHEFTLENRQFTHSQKLMSTLILMGKQPVSNKELFYQQNEFNSQIVQMRICKVKSTNIQQQLMNYYHEDRSFDNVPRHSYYQLINDYINNSFTGEQNNSQSFSSNKFPKIKHRQNFQNNTISCDNEKRKKRCISSDAHIKNIKKITRNQSLFKIKKLREQKVKEVKLEKEVSICDVVIKSHESLFNVPSFEEQEEDQISSMNQFAVNQITMNTLNVVRDYRFIK